MARNFKYSAEMSDFIKAHYLLPAAELAAAFNKEFDTKRTSKQMHGARKARGLKTGRTGRFTKGQPKVAGSGCKRANATSFKKGIRPKNALDIGSEVTTKDGYIRVKVAEPNVWAHKHRINWEKINGPVPDGLVIWFKDQDRTNCSPDNLTLIPRSLQIRYNRLQVNQYDEPTQETLKLIAQITHKAAELKEKLK